MRARIYGDNNFKMLASRYSTTIAIANPHSVETASLFPCVAVYVAGSSHPQSSRWLLYIFVVTSGTARTFPSHVAEALDTPSSFALVNWHRKGGAVHGKGGRGRAMHAFG